MRVKVLLPALFLLAGAFTLQPVKLNKNKFTAFRIEPSLEGMPWYEKFFKEYQTILLAALLLIVALVIVLLVRRLARKKPAASSADETIAKPEADKVRIVDSTAAEAVDRQAMRLQGNIEVFVNDQKLSTYPITDKPITIGRDPAKAMVVIQEPIVSKLHCTIFFQGKEVMIKDNESTNGTYVNDKKISEQTLVDNDTVSLGRKGNIKIRVHR